MQSMTYGPYRCAHFFDPEGITDISRRSRSAPTESIKIFWFCRPRSGSQKLMEPICDPLIATRPARDSRRVRRTRQQARPVCCAKPSSENSATISAPLRCVWPPQLSANQACSHSASVGSRPTGKRPALLLRHSDCHGAVRPAVSESAGSGDAQSLHDRASMIVFLDCFVRLDPQYHRLGFFPMAV